MICSRICPETKQMRFDQVEREKGSSAAMNVFENRLIDAKPLKKADITLSGSFARTCEGHVTGRALPAGTGGCHSCPSGIRDAAG